MPYYRSKRNDAFWRCKARSIVASIADVTAHYGVHDVYAVHASASNARNDTDAIDDAPDPHPEYNGAMVKFRYCLMKPSEKN